MPYLLYFSEPLYKSVRNYFCVIKQSAGVTTAFAFSPNPSLLFLNRFQNPPDPGKPLL